MNIAHIHIISHKLGLRIVLACKALIHLELCFPNIAKGILNQFLSFTFTLLQLSLTIYCRITLMLVI